MQKFIIMWTSEIHFWMAYALMSFNNLELVGCNFDFYIDSHQTKLLYGLDFREIYFIRNGVINQNAITFLNEVIRKIVEIPTYVDRLIFHWHLSQSRTSTSYHMQVIHLPGPIMRTPILNISSNGFLSFEDTVFSIELPCTGRVRDHVDIMIKMTFISKLLDEYNQSIEPLSLNFKRRKLCAKSSNYMMDGSKANENDDLEYPEQRLSPVASTCIAFGSVLTTIIFLFVLLGFLYVTRKKRHPNIPLNSLVHLDYIPHQNFPTNGYKCYSTPDSFSRLSMEKLCSMKETGYQGSPLNSCSKSFSLHFRNNTENSRQLLQNYSSPSSTSNHDPIHSNTIYKYLPSKDESSSLSNISPSVPRSLVIEDGVLRLSSSSGYPPPTANKIQNISSCSSSYSSSISLNPQLHDQQPKSIVSSPLTASSNTDDFFPNGETLGIKTLSEKDEEQSGISKNEGTGSDSSYIPHLYSHLMPKNIKKASGRLPNTETQKSVVI
ncbi:uncharacterized protein [Lepeophtheirus salmonis]|uniref:uncharacterized protein isoform X3 n=1 Tax=Lepeophtheirus salmonis TaxID=72036 RepID=UPI001AE7F962|nr:uncharacterized protein LOC121129357 isoform X2 [Lepeophtheirus salmonis]